MNHHILDSIFLDTPRKEMYLSWTFPDLFPGQPQPKLQNWHPDDLIAYIGGEYAK